MFKLALLFWICISGVKCGYYFATLPNVIRYDHDETVVVSVFGLNNALVKIWLQHGKKRFSAKDVVVQNEENPAKTTVKVTENDLFDTVVEKKPRNIDVCSEYRGVKQCRGVVLSYRTGYLIVQTDKPIYTPLNEVTVRTLALDESLRAVDDWEVGMDIVSPSNKTMARKTVKRSSKGGFFENKFKLPPFPETGIWTARAFYTGQFETESKALFEVQEYVMPTFGVTIDVDTPYIQQDTANIKVTVKAKYVYGKPVKGNARLSLFLKEESGVSEYLLDVRRAMLDDAVIDAEGSEKVFTISVDSILNSAYLRDKDFPDKCRLEIVATVFESATGKEESSTHEETMFAIQGYIFKMTRSKLYFRPGWDYLVKVDTLYANGQPAANEKIKVTMNKDDVFHVTKETTTDSKGQAVVIFTIPNNADIVTFTVETMDGRVVSEQFVVKAYAGKNLIQAEQIIKDNEMFLRASTNIQGDKYTGMLFMIVTRGKVVYTKFKEAANQASEIITNDIQELISPSARLLVFYVDKTTEDLVADSVKFEVNQKCRDRGLKLETTHAQVKPGSNDFLTIKGDPIMWVGLNVMDKALLLLNNKNLLRKNKMFTALESHDLGCGEGSGRNSADVFKLKLDVGQQRIFPGSMAQLTIEGDPLMWVGLNIMDKSLLNDKHVLLKTKIFKAFASHDLGCGEGSGINSADVFNKTGLTVLTNAALSVNDLQRNSVDCDETNRKKRNSRATECYYDADMACCNRGYEFAKEVMKESVYQERLDSSTQCYAKARTLGKDIQTRCLMAVFKSCKTKLEILLSRKRSSPSNQLDEETDYIFDLTHVIDAGIRPRARTYFHDSWLFEVLQLDKSGMATRQLVFPDSITEWIIQAIGITANKGLCIADPFNVTAFRSFFIQLDLPYKGTRLKHFDVKATIFSYGLPMDPSKTANIYLEGAKNLCYSSETGNSSNKIQIELPPNSARTVSFPMIPLKKGKFRIKVTAIVIDSAIPEVDVIEKFLYVVNEGIEEQLTIQVCLDPNKQMEDCKNDPRVFKDVDSVNGQDPERVYSVDLTLPKDSIPGTGSAVAYTESDTMTNVVKTLIENVDSLFRQPAGCGEQTMIRLAPTVYAMMYVKETRQITEEIKGNQWIRDGVTREVSQFRHPDGSYAAWQDRLSSTWLTAFVSKVLCQAKRVVEDAVDEKDDIIVSIDWLKNQVTDDGQFIDHMPVIHREMIGQIDERDPSLTAFVLITLLECDIRTEGIDQRIRKSTKFLENLDKNLLEKNPYILALSTYALAMAKSAKRWEFKALLHKLENRKGKDTYWGNAGGSPASAHSVETTAYALLAMLELSDWRTSAKIVRWLTSQRDAKGSFQTTQGTVVGLQSLSTYSIKTYSPNVNLKVQLLAKQWEAEELELNRENAFVQRIVRDLPVEHNDNVLTVKVSGSGKGIMNIDLRYNRPARDEEDCPFEISYIELNPVNDLPVDPQLAEESKCDVCGYCEEEKDNHGYNFEFSDTQEADPKMVAKREAGRHVRATQTKICIRFSVRSKTEKKFGMSIVNFGLETDVSVVKEDLDKLDFCRLLCVFDTTCPPINYKGLVEKPLKTGKLLADNQNIAGYEMPNSEKDFIVFYLQEVTSDKTKFIFRLKDSFEGDINSRQPSSVKVYDYYNPDMSCTQLYGTGPNKGEGVGYECDKEQKQCQCLQNKCALPVEDDIQTLAKMKKYPALKLYQYTCNPEKANYAVVVEIESVGYDPITQQKTAIARVLKSIHQGIEQLSKDDNMDFFWSLDCAQPNLEEGGIYYIIGKDGNLFRTDEGTKYMYRLMETALVIRKPENRKTKRNRLISLVLRKYEQIINAPNRQGCAS